ncbi:hypothetical protein FRC06_005156 [Ceratobasidium sp. 370]|nr:hypothetical protein FRC06_005156 [Ceratobasidium sp. 370]
MASTTDTSYLPPVSSPETLPARFEQLLNAVARTKKMLVLCGDSASRQASLPLVEAPVDVPHGSETRRTALRTLLRQCSPATVPPDSLDPRVLAGLNAAMTCRRIAARSAPARSFHGFLARMCAQGKLAGCLTTSFDGLEARGDPALEARTIMLHGDNRLVRCCRRNCSGMDQSDTIELDDRFLNPVPSGNLGQLCNSCSKKHKKMALSRRTCGERSLALRPAVEIDLGGDMVAGEAKATMLEFAKGSQLLLIVEQTLKSPSLLELTRDLAEVVHERSGAVIYVGREPLRGRNLFTHIDAQLQIDVSDFVVRVEEEADKVALSGGKDGLEVVYDEQDFWFDVVSNQLPALSRSEHTGYDGEVCERCMCSVPEYLVHCRLCQSRFCCRRIAYDESLSAPLDEQGLVKLIDEPGDQDPFTLEDACVILDHYSKDGSRPRLEQAKRDFVCSDCWNRGVQGLYPVPFFKARTTSPEGECEEGIAALSDGGVLLGAVLAPGQTFGRPGGQSMGEQGLAAEYQCKIEPVKLEHLGEKKRVLENMTWEAGSYTAFVIYFTHGLTGDQGYQLAPGVALQPAQYLEQTLPVASDVLRGAREARCFVVCCGHPLYHSGLVAGLSKWFDSEGLLDTLLMTMNIKLCLVYMLNLLARLSTRMVDADPHAAETMFQTWLSDSLAPSHTDILCLSRRSEPMLWQYAPFQSRPLGKPLPSIMSMCTCPGVPVGEYRQLRRLGSRKAWEVDHNGRDGSALRDVAVKATCTLCRQMWPLPSEHMAGTLRKHLGIYATVVPYFAPQPAADGPSTVIDS